MRYLTLKEVLKIHERVLVQSGGFTGIRDMGALESSMAQPQMTFDGEELYPTIPEKAASLGFSIIQNHPFVDGNKRTRHAAMEVFLILNGYEITQPIDEQELIILQVASGILSRTAFTDWLNQSIVERP